MRRINQVSECHFGIRKFLIHTYQNLAIGCIGRIVLCGFVFSASLLLPKEAWAEDLLQKLNQLALIEWNYFPQSSGEIINSRIPFIPIIVPLVVMFFYTLLIGILLKFFFHVIRKLGDRR